MNKKSFVCGLDEIGEVASFVLKALKNGGIILLQGDLASGKTTFVKSFAKEIGIENEVSSPTFSIMNSYKNRLFHYDIYQSGLKGFLQQGLLEELSKEGIHMIEWGDEEFEKVLKSTGFEYIKIKITPFKNMRKYEVYYA